MLTFNYEFNSFVSFKEIKKIRDKKLDQKYHA